VEDENAEELAVGSGVPLRLPGGLAAPWLPRRVVDGDGWRRPPRKRRTYHGPAAAASSLLRSSRRRSNAVRYRLYPSSKCWSTREEKMSSPRGLVEGGICAITVWPGCDWLWLTRRPCGDRLPGTVTAFIGARAGRRAAGRGKKERKVAGGRRTLKYMFNGRSALFEWFT